MFYLVEGALVPLKGLKARLTDRVPTAQGHRSPLLCLWKKEKKIIYIIGTCKQCF
jgi:hypothetical protein